VVQINFPPEAVVALARVGQEVCVGVEAEPATHEHPVGEHPVFRAALSREAEGPKQGKATHLEGIVERINFARHGEANGVVLDSGDFVHLKPEGMKQACLTVGRRMEVEGKARPMPLGGRVIEADVVNGVALERKKK
jgi:hypothetical protein